MLRCTIGIMPHRLNAMRTLILALGPPVIARDSACLLLIHHLHEICLHLQPPHRVSRPPCQGHVLQSLSRHHQIAILGSRTPVYLRYPSRALSLYTQHHRSVLPLHQQRNSSSYHLSSPPCPQISSINTNL